MASQVNLVHTLAQMEHPMHSLYRTRTGGIGELNACSSFGVTSMQSTGQNGTHAEQPVQLSSSTTAILGGLFFLCLINSGNSGGALVNVNGELIGINTAIISESRGSDGIGFAIPINRAKRIVEELKNTGRVDRSYKTGLTVQPLTPRIALYMDLDISEGLIVVEIEKKSSADRSGIKNGDIIIKVNGLIVNTTNEFRSIIEESDLRQGDKINLKLYRNGRYINKKLILGKGVR